MVEDRFPEDTLFIVAEEDFRFERPPSPRQPSAGAAPAAGSEPTAGSAADPEPAAHSASSPQTPAGAASDAPGSATAAEPPQLNWQAQDRPKQTLIVPLSFAMPASHTGSFETTPARPPLISKN